MAPATKKWGQIIRSAAPVTQNHLSKPKDHMLQNATLLQKSAPWPPNISDEHASCTAPATRNASLQILFKCPTPANGLKLLQNLHVLVNFDKVHTPLCLPRRTTSERPKVVHAVFLTFWLRNVLRATTACTFSTCQFPKAHRDHQFLTLLALKCASRHNGVHFFDSSTSKSGPRMMCLVHFDFKMCFSPHRRTHFRHLNFQKWSDIGVLCTFWLRNVLRAATACNFSFLIWPHGSAPAASASLLYDPPEPQTIGKHTLSYLFAHLILLSSDSFSSVIFFLLLFSSLLFSSLIWLFPPLLFHLSILSEVWLLNSLR